MVYVMDHALQELMDHGYGENAMLAMLSVKHVLEIHKMIVKVVIVEDFYMVVNV